MSNKFLLNGPFSILVPGLTGERDSQGNPVKRNQKIELQILLQGGSGIMGRKQIEDGFSAYSGTLTVIDNDFNTGQAILFLGDFEIISGVHYTVGASTADTATALAAVISNLRDFEAVANASDVEITGPVGERGDIRFEIQYTGTIVNFDYSPFDVDKKLTPGDPTFGPPRFS